MKQIDLGLNQMPVGKLELLEVSRSLCSDNISIIADGASPFTHKNSNVFHLPGCVHRNTVVTEPGVVLTCEVYGKQVKCFGGTAR